MGLKKLGMGARGLMLDEESEEDVVVVGQGDRGRGKKGRKKRGRESLSANKVFGKDELERQTHEILKDKENLHVRRVRMHVLSLSYYILITRSIGNRVLLQTRSRKLLTKSMRWMPFARSWKMTF